MLNSLLKYRTWILAFLGLFLMLWFVSGSPHFKECIDNAEYPKGQQTSKKGVPVPPVPLTLDNYRECTWFFLEKDAEPLIAIFTGLLFLYTAFLWGATRRLVKDAKHTSERQLQAYVYFDGPTIVGWPRDKPNRASVRVNVVNSGTTWARNVSYQSARVPMEPGEEGDPFDKAKWSDKTRPFALGPGQKVELQIGDIPFAYMEAIRDGKKRMFIVGKVTYEDAVRSPPGFHQTQMSRKFRVDDEGGHSLTYMATHNCVDEDCP